MKLSIGTNWEGKALEVVGYRQLLTPEPPCYVLGFTLGGDESSSHGATAEEWGRILTGYRQLLIGDFPANRSASYSAFDALIRFHDLFCGYGVNKPLSAEQIQAWHDAREALERMRP